MLCRGDTDAFTDRPMLCKEGPMHFQEMPMPCNERPMPCRRYLRGRENLCPVWKDRCPVRDRRRLGHSETFSEGKKVNGVCVE